MLEVLFITRGLNVGVYHSPGCFLNFPRLCVDGPALWGSRPLSLGCLHSFLDLGLGCLGEIIKEEVRFHDGFSHRRGSPHGGSRLPPLENVLSIHDRRLVLYFDFGLVIREFLLHELIHEFGPRGYGTPAFLESGRGHVACGGA